MNPSNVDPAEWVRRFFAPLPFDWLTRFKPGGKVRLIRPAYWLPIVPVGAPGVVLVIDADTMAAKGRPYHVEFDLRTYALKQRDFIPEKVLLDLGIDPDEPLTFLRTYLGPDDLGATP